MLMIELLEAGSLAASVAGETKVNGVSDTVAFCGQDALVSLRTCAFCSTVSIASRMPGVSALVRNSFFTSASGCPGTVSMRLTGEVLVPGRRVAGWASR
ncbi:hypothetical protein [Hydrogenophaga sp.]|uniref:hypothetical protein n=1 Tax=Hydrogenophaga sp. TaxID=1904254 RepID=UPI00271ECA45|nr:hypothetical protein [Hydrogenophaga sp.]MDO9438331.1 hypothetical protein [Hydrogenophaga sp.]